MAKGCEWNNQLAKENFQTNFKEHGLQYAKQALRTDIHHWMAKREGRPVPKWKANVDQEGHLVVDKQRLIDLTGAPLTKKVNSPISEAVKALVPIEVETVRQADKLAQQGAKKIYIPEHAPEGIHFITVYTQSTDNPREYIGSQIDLGENVTWEQAKKRIREFIGIEFSKIHQSAVHKEAFVFVANSNVDRGYQRSVVDVFANEAIVTSQKVLTDVTSTAVSVGVFAMENLRRRRAQQLLEANEKKKKKIIKKEKTKEDNNLFSIRERQEQVKSKKKEMRNMIRVITIGQFAAETGVGVGGALFILRQSLMKEKRIVQVSVLEKNETKRKRKVKMRERLIFKEKHTKEKKRKRRQKRILQEMFVKKTLKKEQKRTMYKKERKSKEKKQKPIREITVFKKEVILWKVLLRLGRKFAERKPNRKKRSAESPVRLGKKLARREMKQIRVKERKRVVVTFVFAWILWTFLRKFEFKHAPFKHSFKKEKKIAYLAKKEPSQWLLLAIIWYLAMIREQGMLRTHKTVLMKNKNNRPQNKRLYISPLAPSGVIFALSS